jgi:hypothetical protein
MTDDRLRTALVVLASPANAELVRNWFSFNGFDVDPVVGIAFAISGPASLFRRALGGADDGAPVELGPAELRGRVDDEVLAHLAAIVVTPPPDFGAP